LLEKDAILLAPAVDTRKIVALIARERQPEVVEKILKHRKL
jgi:hypothetical protein